MTATKNMNTTSFASDMAELMAGWNKIEAAAKAQFPKASEEELYQICKGAMAHAIGLKTKP